MPKLQVDRLLAHVVRRECALACSTAGSCSGVRGGGFAVASGARLSVLHRQSLHVEPTLSRQSVDGCSYAWRSAHVAPLQREDNAATTGGAGARDVQPSSPPELAWHEVLSQRQIWGLPANDCALRVNTAKSVETSARMDDTAFSSVISTIRSWFQKYSRVASL